MKVLDTVDKIARLLILTVVIIGLNEVGSLEKRGKLYGSDKSKTNITYVKKVIIRSDRIITFQEKKSMYVSRKYSNLLNRGAKERAYIVETPASIYEKYVEIG